MKDSIWGPGAAQFRADKLIVGHIEGLRSDGEGDQFGMARGASQQKGRAIRNANECWIKIAVMITESGVSAESVLQRSSDVLILAMEGKIDKG